MFGFAFAGRFGFGLGSCRQEEGLGAGLGMVWGKFGDGLGMLLGIILARFGDGFLSRSFGRRGGYIELPIDHH